MIFLLLLVLPTIAALPLPHHINVDGFIFCPDGKAPSSVTVVIKDGNEDNELLRKVFSPAEEYCLTVEDFVDVKASHPEITLYASCVTEGKNCIYQGKQAIPTNFLDSEDPFRPTFKATAANLKICEKN